MKKSELYYDIKCDYCGEYFTPKSINNKFCGKDCLSEHHKDENNRKKKLTDYIIFERDNFKCVYCGKSSIEDGVKLIMEHIYPIKRGGEADMFNIVTACTSCNASKFDRMMSDDNILRLWNEIESRNEASGYEHYNMLRDKLNKQLIYRKERLV